MAKKGKKSYFGIIAVIALLIFAVFLYKELKPEPSAGSTVLYFNAETDLPSEISLGLLNVTKGMKGPEQLVAGDKYEIVFTVISNELSDTDYIMDIYSKIYKETKEFTLEPAKSRTFTLTVEPTDRWVIDHEESDMRKDEIDIPDDAWLGTVALVPDKDNQFDVRYLPLSHDLSGFGENTYQTDMTLDEIKYRPFTKTYTDTVETKDQKTVTTIEVTLQVKSNRLIVDYDSVSKVYIP
ncbi:hypothetical protein COT47_01070, partial [Candidatus Woesearchaeota archaeon CG08_land_8_20_14_0_20_43_7]